MVVKIWSAVMPAFPARRAAMSMPPASGVWAPRKREVVGMSQDGQGGQGGQDGQVTSASAPSALSTLSVFPVWPQFCTWIIAEIAYFRVHFYIRPLILDPASVSRAQNRRPRARPECRHRRLRLTPRLHLRYRRLLRPRDAETPPQG